MSTTFLETIFTGAHFPATIILGFVLVYWLMVLLVGFGMDAIDLDLDLDVDVDDGGSALFSLGGVTVSFLNLSKVPLIIWLTAFALSLWLITYFTNDGHNIEFSWMTLIFLRNCALAIIPTKILTQPLVGVFDTKGANTVEDLIGREGKAIIEITPKHGRGEFKSEASPLLLSIRSWQGVIESGESIVIVDHDSAANVYVVERFSSKK